MTDRLEKARACEAEATRRAGTDDRPLFHLTPPSGWLNDPNGFSYYKGRYHLFFQYYPYDTAWNDMHWGHAVSSDLLSWTCLPAALAPDEPYDADGCFSGSALTLPGGEHFLMYTGVVREKVGSRERYRQRQCLAVGDGLDYRKYAGNPVLSEKDLPSDADPYECRDPFLFRGNDGAYRCLLANADKTGRGRALLYKTTDPFDWTEKEEFQKDGGMGRILTADASEPPLMWECPSLVRIGQDYVFLTGVMDLLPADHPAYRRRHTLYRIGRYDEEKETFRVISEGLLDQGIDFYAPQVLTGPDGRVILTGWLQAGETTQTYRLPKAEWVGQLALPRELFIRDGQLCQRPVRETEKRQHDPIVFCSRTLDNERVDLDGIRGRVMELSLTIRPGAGCETFCLSLAEDRDRHTDLVYDVKAGQLILDRSASGIDPSGLSQSRAVLRRKAEGEDWPLDLRLILDRYSLEVFADGGRVVMSALIYTELSAEGLSFSARGKAEFDLIKYDLDGPKTV